MAAVRGILVKQFGGPEVLEYVSNIVQPLKPAAKQVFLHLCCTLIFYVFMTATCLHIQCESKKNPP